MVWWDVFGGIWQTWVQVYVGAVLIVGHFPVEAFQVDYVGVQRRFRSAKSFAWWDFGVQGNAAVVAWAISGILVEDIYPHDRGGDLKEDAVGLVGVCRVGNPARFGGDRRLVCPPLEWDVILEP